MVRQLIDLASVGVLFFVVASRALAMPSLEASVEDSIVESLSATSHATTVTLRGLQSSYVIATPEGSFQNQRLILRNPDARLAVILALNVAGRPDLSSVDGMLGSIVTDAMSAEQKAVAIWQFVVDWRYHYIPAEETDEVHDPVKLINVYGYGFCDDAAYAIEVLSEAAGLPARVVGIGGHTIAEVYFDGAWHMLDADHEVIYRADDGHILSVDELAADPSAILATPFDPVGADTVMMASLYTSTADNYFSPPAPTSTHRIEPVLEPLDEVVFDLAPGTVYSESAAERAANPEYGPPPSFSNGTLTRPIDFSRDASERVIPVAWPFLLVGGDLSLEFARADADAEISIACDGASYDVVPTTRTGPTLAASLRAWFDARLIGSYACNLRVRALGSAPLSEILSSGEIRWLFQFAPRALQQLKPGGTSASAALTPVNGPVPADWKGIEIVHEWAEPQHFLRAGAQRFSQGASLPTQVIEAATSVNADSIVLTVLTGGGAIPNLQVLLDTDANSATGFRSQAMGSEFMVLSGRLFAYTGPSGATTQTLGSWSYLGPAPRVALRADVVQLTIPTTSLGLLAGSRLNVRIRNLQDSKTLLDELPRGNGRWQVSVPNIVQQSGSEQTDLVRADVAFESSRMVLTLQTVASALETFNILLDTDSNAASGYATGSLGADFLISSGFLYRYTGTAEGEWSWSVVGPVTLTPSDTNLLQVGVPLAPLGMSSGARLTLRVDNWRDWSTYLDSIPRVGSWQIVAPNVLAQPGIDEGDLVAGEATVQRGSILFTLETLGRPIELLHVLLNTDADPATGYMRRSLGSDYLIENNALYRFSGQTPGEWSWTRVDAASLRLVGPTTLEVVVPTAGMNLGAAGVTALVENWHEWTTLLDSMPRAVAGWQIRF